MISFKFDELVWNGKHALPEGATNCIVHNVWGNSSSSGTPLQLDGGVSANVSSKDVVFVVLHACT